MKIKPKICKLEGCNNEFVPFNSLQRACSPQHERRLQQLKKKAVNKKAKPVNKISKKQKVLNAKYIVARAEFLAKPENKICFIDGCNKKADTVEHRKGRKGYADDYAKQNDIPLIIDERFFAPCCNAHNLELENNPELSRQYQLSKLHDGKKIDKSITNLTEWLKENPHLLD